MNFDYCPGLSGWRKSISTASGLKTLSEPDGQVFDTWKKIMAGLQTEFLQVKKKNKEKNENNLLLSFTHMHLNSHAWATYQWLCPQCRNSHCWPYRKCVF